MDVVATDWPTVDVKFREDAQAFFSGKPGCTVRVFRDWDEFRKAWYDDS